MGTTTIIGEAAPPLSGGESSVFPSPGHLKDAPIIILDEATSSVTWRMNRRFLSAIQGELTKDKTLISIAHRLSTVRNADQIIVIDQGRIVQRGNTSELLQRREFTKGFNPANCRHRMAIIAPLVSICGTSWQKRNCSRDEKGGMLYLYLGQIL